MNKLRLNIDRIAQLVEQLASDQLPVGTSIHILLGCIKKLRMAKAWSGTYLGYETGSSSLYKNDGQRKTVADIEPTDSVANVPTVDQSTLYGQKNYIEKIDYLRQEIKLLIGVISIIVPTGGREAHIARTNVFNYLAEARFELGFELARLRDE